MVPGIEKNNYFLKEVSRLSYTDLVCGVFIEKLIQNSGYPRAFWSIIIDLFGCGDFSSGISDLLLVHGSTMPTACC